MGLLRLAQFSSIGNLFDKISFRTQQKEKIETQISSDFLQNLLNNGERVFDLGNQASGGGSQTLYTCPVGKVCYIVLAGMSADNNSGALPNSVLYRINGKNWINMDIDAGDVENMQFPLMYPIKLIAGETLNIVSGSDAGVTGWFLGYELDFKSEVVKV